MQHNGAATNSRTDSFVRSMTYSVVHNVVTTPMLNTVLSVTSSLMLCCPHPCFDGGSHKHNMWHIPAVPQQMYCPSPTTQVWLHCLDITYACQSGCNTSHQQKSPTQVTNTSRNPVTVVERLTRTGLPCLRNTTSHERAAWPPGSSMLMVNTAHGHAVQLGLQHPGNHTDSAQGAAH